MLSAAAGEAAFPLGSGERHTQSVPFTRALQARWLGLHDVAGAGGPLARLRLPCHPAVRGADGAIDRRALVALLDHAGAPACYGAGVSTGATATLELRVDFAMAPMAGADLVLETRCLTADGWSALVVGEARHEGDARPVARMSGRYAVGLGPGRANDEHETAAARAANAARHADAAAPEVVDFGALLRGAFQGDDFVLPFQPWLVGSVALPALHGGVVAAGLMNAASHARPGSGAERAGGLRLASLNLQFLRAARAEETRFSGHAFKSGARAAYVAARATQQAGGREVATLQALYA